MVGDVFVGVRVVGGLLPSDVLSRLVTGRGVSHLEPADFHLAGGESVRDAANRVWPYLQGVWSSYRAAIDGLPAGVSTTSATREKFLLVLLDQLGYGRVSPTGRGGLTADGHGFPISHAWESVPIHLLGSGTSLDTRTKGVAGAATGSPQSMVQDFLNRSDDHVWAIVSNGQVLRLLRDSTSLVGSAYVEFDLEAIFGGDLFADFVLLFTLCHESRLEIRDPEIGASSCRLEAWRTEALETGSRALNQLRDGVLEALRTLGTGFLTNPANVDLRQRLSSGSLSVDDVHHALLRVVYRLLFTFVAEDRGALLNPQADATARQRYFDYFSTARLRRVARRRGGSRHGDRWQALTLVWRGLGNEQGLPELGLSGIGGLFDRGELDFLTDEQLSNEALLRAVRSLSLVREPRSGVLRLVDYRNLGAEELGSIYEALLEFVPQWDTEAKQYTLDIAAGNQRKDTGSYYTPTSLVDSLLDTALEPVLDDAVKSKHPQTALLRVTVCDPACGSGHFLVGAARRIAKRLAMIRTGDPEPAPEAIRTAIRDVTGNCIYGADVNPLAAELAKVSLWMEALEPGQPLSFLDAQIKVGNALIGATPALLEDGLPNDAFKPIEGDDIATVTILAKLNRTERANQGSLYDVEDLFIRNADLADDLSDLLTKPALSLSDVHVQQQRLRVYTESPDYRQARLAADAWCAAFVWPKHAGAVKAITHTDIISLNAGNDTLTQAQRDEITRLAAQYRFFHWHLEYPHLFPTTPLPDSAVNTTTGWAGGFTTVIGNPPWERVKLQEQEFFAARDPDIASAPNAAARKRLIADLEHTNPALLTAFKNEKRLSEGFSHLLRNSGRYPLTGRGDINTYAVFAETNRNLIAGDGRLGNILPTGIATDATTQYLFKDLVESMCISSMYDFENRKPLFEDVDSRFKFCLLTITGSQSTVAETEFAFFAHDPRDLLRDDIRFVLKPSEVSLLNPNTGTCPIFRSRRDADIALRIYRRLPVLINEATGSPWRAYYMRLVDSGDHSEELLDAQAAEDRDDVIALHEAKAIHQYNPRFATYTGTGYVEAGVADLKDPSFKPTPHYWVGQQFFEQLMSKYEHQDWLLGYRGIARATDARTIIACAFPVQPATRKLPVLGVGEPNKQRLLANMNSFVLDYVARQKVPATDVSFFIVKQLPFLPPESYESESPWSPHQTTGEWFDERILKLNFNDTSMEKFAVSCGGDGLKPIAWDEVERHRIQCEIDAAMFIMYGLNRDDIEYILNTFTIIKRRELANHGAFHTLDEILRSFDSLTAKQK